MDLSVGLPSRPRRGEPDHVIAWALRADAGPFRSLAAGDRIVAPAHEALVGLAVAAGVTHRILLQSSVVVGPSRETTLLTRQAASIDAISGGRLTLGLGVGAREDDYAAVGASFDDRGTTFDRQLAELRRLWAAGPSSVRIGVPAVRLGGPELLIGGYVRATARRVASWGDGYVAPGGAAPDRIERMWQAVLAAWTAAGRTGRPRFVGGTYVSLGPDADAAAARYIADYYGYEPALAERRLRAIPRTPTAVRQRIAELGGIGFDELILRPVEADPRFLDRLEDAVGGA